jgi:hypothetical protein
VNATGAPGLNTKRSPLYLNPGASKVTSKL